MTTPKFTLDEFLKTAIQQPDFIQSEARGSQAGKTASLEVGAERFLKGFYADSMENEFLGYSLEELVELARNFWMLGAQRKSGETLLTVKSIETHLSGRKETVIQIVTDDKAFLVDSVTSHISSFGIDVLGLFHPIVDGFRDKAGKWVSSGEAVTESMILAVIPEQSDRRMEELEAALLPTLEDVRVINEDFKSMVLAVKQGSLDLQSSHGAVSDSELEEATAFLDWVADGNFVLLGARDYKFTQKTKDGDVDYTRPIVDNSQSLGVLKNSDTMVLRQSSEPSVIASNAKGFISRVEPVTVEKSNLFSAVHRRVRMDYISVKHYDADGQVVGETRFVGLFTSDAYSRSPEVIPLIRRKVERVLKRSEFSPTSHSGKALAYVLSTYPRDELFQISEDELFRISTGVAQAYDRPRPRVFIRRDPYNRFVSALVYIPREHYNTRVRESIGEHIKTAFNGRVSAFYPQYSDAPMARVCYIIGLNPGEQANPDVGELEAQVARLAQPWFGGVKHSMEMSGETELITRYENAFDAGYQARFSVDIAHQDILNCEALSAEMPVKVKVYNQAGDGASTLRAKIYSWKYRLSLSKIMPVLTHFDLHVAEEMGYEIRRKGDDDAWIYDFEMVLPDGVESSPEIALVFEQAFMATWSGLNEGDAFNRLILRLGADWRDIAFLRLLARYRRQSGLDPSERVQIEALVTHPQLTRHLIALKTAKFDPQAFELMENRKTDVSEKLDVIWSELDSVKSLDHDRVIRRMARTLEAALRTNFYQKSEDGTPKPYISLKIASRTLEDLPAPVPYREIYVSSPIVEGVHLRFGPVSRGGLRWSDRQDDFRTEVLGLVKAQQVKNSVIVPVGSKGGFYPKMLPVGGTRDEVQAAAIEAYKTFISSLLDLTDNYKGKLTVPPANVVCWDDPDPYLVVAADKGTATFSDIANGVSESYGFWLGDAFASGGSVGYDHKAMGITARGAWEATKRHFRELGKNIQTEEFTAIGCGDMSGDVFGNGMLLSEKTQLIAAFDHRDIFIDPNPNTAKSFKERTRLFNLPRSSWQDYKTDLISKGGGIFPRAAKSITLSDEMKEMTGLSAASVTPDQLIHALLKSETELLWFGGIGTYIKGSHESHAAAGDKANDNIRVDANDVKASVIGEGANLGMTQAGRVEFAMRGGKNNTDAIDNSAGVDTSDNEVNIKILLGGAMDSKELSPEKRVPLLESMTQDVANLVLQHNYDQTGALSLARMQASDDHNAYERLMISLEKDGLLNRDVEGLPDTLAMQARKDNDVSLTRPEIAVLMAYVKNRLFDQLIKSDLADDPYFNAVLLAYFPPALHGFEKAMANHRLRREIITSRITNKIVDTVGPLFMLRLEEQTDKLPHQIAWAFYIALETLRIKDLLAQISALDNQVKAEAQLQLHNEIAGVMRRVVSWLLRNAEMSPISEQIAPRREALTAIHENWLEMLSPFDQKRARSRIKRFERVGVPHDLAADVSLLRARASGFDVLNLTQVTGENMTVTASLFYSIGAFLKVDKIRSVILKTTPTDHWESLALQQLEEDFFILQAGFTATIAQKTAKNSEADKLNAPKRVQLGFKDSLEHVRPYDEMLSEMFKSDSWSAAKLSIASSRLRDLLTKLT